MATEANEMCGMKIVGTPLLGPNTGHLFALAHHMEELKKLPSIEKERQPSLPALVAYPLLSSIFEELGDKRKRCER